MTGLIKSAAAKAGTDPICAFGLALEPTYRADSCETMLEARVAELRAAIASAEERHQRELEEAREEAAREVLEQRSDAEDRAIEALCDAAGQANDAWTRRLRSWESGSIAIARKVLEQVFADASSRSALVESSIRRRIQVLETHAIVQVRVSEQDFPDPLSLAAANRAAGGQREIVCDAALPSGACIVDLKLGHVDLGLDAQWARIAELLEVLELEGAPC